MAAEDSSYSQVKAFERAMLPESLKCILRTCGGESAARLLERRDAYLIESYQEDERGNRCLFDGDQDFIQQILHFPAPWKQMCG